MDKSIFRFKNKADVLWIQKDAKTQTFLMRSHLKLI